MPDTLSSMMAVSVPRFSDCFLNMLYVRFAINEDTTSDSGVTTTTAAAISGCLTSMKISVPRIVITPVNSCVKPIRTPSDSCSTSDMTRETMSPSGCASMVFSGSFAILRNAASRMSRDVSNDSRLFTALIIH